MTRSFFESLYKESAIKIPRSAFHNQYFNFYWEDDNEPIYFPSTLFMFNRTKNIQNAIVVNPNEELVYARNCDSIILSSDTEDPFGVLNTIRGISKL